MNEIQSRTWLTKDEATAFIGNNADFYLEKWKSHPDSFFKGWNWAAAIFRVEWMAYRKMYLEAFLTLLAVVILGIAIDGLLGLVSLSVPDGVARSVIQILIGFFANSLYRTKAIRALHKTNNMDDAQRIGYLSKRGGTSVVGVVILLLIEIAIIIVPPIIIRQLF